MDNYRNEPRKKKSDKKIITRQKNGPYSTRSARIKESQSKILNTIGNS